MNPTLQLNLTAKQVPLCHQRAIPNVGFIPMLIGKAVVLDRKSDETAPLLDVVNSDEFFAQIGQGTEGSLQIARTELVADNDFLPIRTVHR